MARGLGEMAAPVRFPTLSVCDHCEYQRQHHAGEAT